MSTYVEGTIIQSTVVEAAKYEYAPRDAQDDRPWRAIDVPEILLLLVGDENKEVRFNAEDIQEGIEDGDMVVIHTP